MNVQPFINNISFPKTIDELINILRDRSRFYVEDILYEDPTAWTVPKWAMVNDIVFFFHAKTAIQSITRLVTTINDQKEDIDNYDFLMQSLQHARNLYNQYGGKIYAIGRVLDRPFYGEPDIDGEINWKGNIFAPIGDICILKEPIPIEDFNNFIRVSRQSAITPVLGDDFEHLKDIIAAKNEVPEYLMDSTATPFPLKEVTEQNWLIVTREYRRQFHLEMQFRKFYVDFLLKSLGDIRTFYTECECYKKDKLSGYADYSIRLNKKLCFVEVKLDFDAESDFKGQLKEYSFVDKAKIKKDKWVYKDNILQDFVIIIDTEQIGVYDAGKDEITIIEMLDNIQNKDDIMLLKQKIIKAIGLSN